MTLLIIVNDHVRIDENLQEQWIFSYVELLRRFEFYEIATEIAHYSRSKLVREQNQVLFEVFESFFILNDMILVFNHLHELPNLP